MLLADSATQDLMKDLSATDVLGVPMDYTIGALFTKAFPYLYVFGGFVLFVMLVWGGFEMLTGATDTKAQEAGKQRISAAGIGFLLLFVSYWLIQIIEIVFKINIL